MTSEIVPSPFGDPGALAIELLALQFSYRGTKTKTLDVPTLRIARGEQVFLYGASGSGKSTLLEILAGVLIPQSGQAHILGQNLASLSPAARDQFRALHLGYVFQSFNLIPYLSVQENITLPLHLSPERRARLVETSEKKEVARLLERLGIVAIRKKRVTELSVGQQQRVAVARALIGFPELILADEPTSSLDQDRREQFVQLLFEICRERKTTVVFVSHDRSLEKFFSRVISFAEMNFAAATAAGE